MKDKIKIFYITLICGLTLMGGFSFYYLTKASIDYLSQLYPKTVITNQVSDQYFEYGCVKTGYVVRYQQPIASDNMGMDFDKVHPGYAKGVNDALDAIGLLYLELKLKGENKSYGEMSNIVRERLHVEIKK